jgi:microcystin-dependent protein
MEPLIGQIQAFGFNFAPRGWALCNGQIMSIAQNTALFSLLGTTYGGDGRTSFALPDLRGRTTVHVGQGPGLSDIYWGESGGRESVTLTSSNLPSHSHTAQIKCFNGDGTKRLPSGNFLAGDATVSMFSDQAPDATLNPTSVALGNTGGNTSFNMRSPFLGVYVCIALVGIFPSRS